ncbi:cell surface protein, partial [Nocardia farcinica]|nr:cell surface protein [Nocardia farcinica]
APAPAAPSAPAPQAAAPTHDVRPTSADDGLPAPNALSVIGGLAAMALAAAGAGAVSFQSASAAQARVDAARAEFFGPRS